MFHVLAVDDTATDRMIIASFLKKNSCQVTCVDSGIKALELLGVLAQENDNEVVPIPSDDQQSSHGCLLPRTEVDMIITDYCMPGMTGYDLLKKVKRSKFFKHVPVVIMSSEAIPSRINDCLEEGAEDFLLKPVKQRDIEKLKPYFLKSRAVGTLNDDQS